MNPILGEDYTLDAFEPFQIHFSGLNVKCPICQAGFGAVCRNRDHKVDVTEMHRARRSRAKKIIRTLEREQLGYYDTVYGQETLVMKREPRTYNPVGWGKEHDIWRQAFLVKELFALQSMQRAQMEIFKRKLRGETEVRSATTTGRMPSSGVSIQQMAKQAQAQMKPLTGLKADMVILDEWVRYMK